MHRIASPGFALRRFASGLIAVGTSAISGQRQITSVLRRKAGAHPPARELGAQLDPVAWQVHRGTIVNLGRISTTMRDRGPGDAGAQDASERSQCRARTPIFSDRYSHCGARRAKWQTACLHLSVPPPDLTLQFRYIMAASACLRLHRRAGVRRAAWRVAPDRGFPPSSRRRRLQRFPGTSSRYRAHGDRCCGPGSRAFASAIGGAAIATRFLRLRPRGSAGRLRQRDRDACRGGSRHSSGRARAAHPTPSRARLCWASQLPA